MIIAGAGGAAHLPGMTRRDDAAAGARRADREPKALKGLDSLLSIVQMPAGVPVGTLAIGEAGAINAGAARRRDPGARRRRARRPRSTLARGADRRRRRGRRSDRCLTPICRPGSTIGILGGGQLGRMLALAAAELGLSLPHLSPTSRSAGRCRGRRRARSRLSTTRPRSPPSPAASTWSPSSSRTCRPRALELAGRSAPVLAPGQTPLTSPRTAWPRRTSCAGSASAVAAYAAGRRRRHHSARVERIGRPAILKTRRLGYDGKGQALIAHRGRRGWRRLRSIGERAGILEGFVAFEREISVIVARGATASCRSTTAVENRHENGILAAAVAPAPDRADDARRGRDDRAARSPRRSDHVGVLAVEMFVAPSRRRSLVNEIAPRVHNSGHWTIDACLVSQFEQHIRAIAGWPLGDPARHSRRGDDQSDRRRRRRTGASSPATDGAPASLRQGRGAAGPQDGPHHAAPARRLSTLCAHGS